MPYDPLEQSISYRAKFRSNIKAPNDPLHNRTVQNCEKSARRQNSSYFEITETETFHSVT